MCRGACCGGLRHGMREWPPTYASRRSERMQSYYWVKTFHIVFVVAWMATVFYLPRILVNLAETAASRR
jgi:hypothetical protein